MEPAGKGHQIPDCTRDEIPHPRFSDKGKFLFSPPIQSSAKVTGSRVFVSVSPRIRFPNYDSFPSSTQQALRR
jgi:hypothetical protein